MWYLVSLWEQLGPKAGSLTSFCYGTVFALPVILIGRSWLVSYVTGGAGGVQHEARVYGLDHGVMNINTTSSTWWMNMGFWKDQSEPTNFAHACAALLNEVLRLAGIASFHSPLEGQPNPQTHRSEINVIDVGIGCGDQSIVISRLHNVKLYVGITLDSRQYQFAKQRLLVETSKRENSYRDPDSFQLFQADAANPNSWPDKLMSRLSDVRSEVLEVKKSKTRQTWLLALDTLYHFKPSRQRIFEYAHGEQQASIAAFDLLLTDRPLTFMQRMVLQITCTMTSAPYDNFMTEAQYRAHLVSAGYDGADIHISDISEHVFAPLVEFLNYQHRQLQVMGLSLGKFLLAKRLFNWWATTGIVKGCIVIAKHEKIRHNHNSLVD